MLYITSASKPVRKIRYKYYLTALGLKVVTTALKLREMFIIPSLAGYQPR